MVPPRVDSSAFEATLIGQSPEHDPSSSRNISDARVELVSGSGPGMDTETEALLRVRLRAASIVLLVAVGAFFVRSFLVEDAPARTPQAGVFCILAIVVAILSSKQSISLSRLRQFEIGIFAMLTVYLGYYEFRLVLTKAREGNPIFQLAAIKSCILYFFAVILLYGTFIPNTWQRAARIIVPLALAPFIVMGCLRLSSTAVNDLASEVANFEQMSDHLIMMTLGAAASLYGTHIINTLRVEAFKARQMGQYHLKERLGAGGMGEVYLAEHRLLKRPCAIKVIRPGRQADPAAIERFEREVRTTAKLSHWNTVNVFDYGRTDDGTFFYVMEYLHGWSLADLVQRHGPLPPARAIHLLRQTCRALHEAHASGLVHRDIKPANIFAARLGGVCDVAKLLDFGLVRHTADAPNVQLSQNVTFSGSPLYMAPEQGRAGEEPDARSDIYSLGATAYYLLTARPPFDGNNIVQVLLAHAHDAVVPPSRITPGIPGDIEQVVLRCLSKQPEERFADAQAVENALARCGDANRWTDTDAARWWTEVEAERTPQSTVAAGERTPEDQIAKREDGGAKMADGGG
jgi:serine/threonine-protein kinase